MVRFPRSWDEPYVPDGNSESNVQSRTTRPPNRAPDFPPGKPVDMDTVLAAAQSPRQQELARRIYAQLKAGAEADDIQDLISDLRRTAIEQVRLGSSSATRSYGGRA